MGVGPGCSGCLEHRVPMKRGYATPIGAAVVLALWGGAIAFGIGVMVRYDSTPGATQAAPDSWPTESAIPKREGVRSVVMFLHPKCPCSRATVAELEALMADVKGKADVSIVLLSPLNEVWHDTAIARTVRAMPGVSVRQDVSAREATAFRARVSGETFVYAENGSLLFHGGITGARGRPGINPGRQAVLELALRNSSPVTQTPTYGCSIEMISLHATTERSRP